MFSLFLFFSFVSAVSLPSRHDHSARGALPSTWFHPRDHPANKLFKRGGDGITYAEVGSQAWMNAFPTAAPDSTKLPAEWVQALNDAVSSGKVPNIPQSSNTPGTNPVYPQGHNPSSVEVCSATYKCRNPDDFWDAPDGYFATSFDDGPFLGTPKLINFLKDKEPVTHFMIGVNIRNNPQQFLAAFNENGDIAVHTYTHRYMTTLSNLDVVAELGWTMELIHNSTGGRVPRFWRPPYGDSDNRVRAIAKEVFGLDTVIWNQDTADWSMASGGTTMEKINASLTQWITGPKSPGLMILEHELTEDTVQAFMNAYPLIVANGWKIKSVAQLFDGDSAYRNADGSDSQTVTPEGILVADTPSSSSTPSSSTSASSLTTTTTVTTSTRSTTSIASTGSSTPNSTAKNLQSMHLRTSSALLICVFLFSHML